MNIFRKHLYRVARKHFLYFSSIEVSFQMFNFHEF